MTRPTLSHWLLRLLAAAAIVSGLLLGAGPRAKPALAANGVVGDGQASSCTPEELHGVVDAVQATGGGLITFACGGSSSGYDYFIGDTLTITTSVTFDGSALGLINLSAGDLHRVFIVQGLGRLTLNNVTVSLGRVNDGFGGCILNLAGSVALNHSLVHTCRSGPPFGAPLALAPDGSAASGGGAIYNANGTVALVNSQVLSSSAEIGGGIQSFGSLSLLGSRLAGNTARDFGGGLSATGAITIVNSLIEHNASLGTGGGIVGTSSTQLTLAGSRIYSNTASFKAGGLYSQDVLTSTNSQIDENQAGEDGGGLFIEAGTASLVRTLLRGNRSGKSGGGIFNNDAGAITLAGSELRANITPTGTVSAGNGGALYSEGQLAIRDSLFQGNQARYGAGLMAAGSVTTTTVTIDRTTFSQNEAGQDGGGIWVDNVYTRVTLTDVLIQGNTALNGGGMVHHYGGASLNRVTLSGNHAGELGGGYYDHDTGWTAMTNVTISGNTAGDSGGGLHTGQTLTLTNVTLANNTAPNTGGLVRNGTLFPYTLRNVLLAGNTGGNCSGPDGTGIASLSTDNTCAFISSNANALLGPLQINGGLGGFLLPTHLPLLGSDAINGGTNSGCPATDERGAARPAGSSCDVGAVETGSALPWLALPLLRR
ncbi:MAG: choice-of-anchor Q domain-containing protein [Anaerolineales bacterium]